MKIRHSINSIRTVRRLVRNASFLGMAFLSSKRNNWEDEFDPHVYLRTRYPRPGTVKNHFAEFLLSCLHRFRTTLEPSYVNPNGIRVLEFGCGPVPIHTASFATQASEIVLAEYLEKNREEVTKWLMEDKSSYNWTPYIQYLVHNLEGDTDNSSVLTRERKIKEVIKAVVPCNILEDPPIQHNVKEGYDVILSVFCIEAGTRTAEQYVQAVQKLSCLLKPGGYLLLFSGKWNLDEMEGRRGYYSVGDKMFFNVPVTSELVSQALERCGGHDINVSELDDIPKSYYGIQYDMSGFIFASAKYH